MAQLAATAARAAARPRSAAHSATLRLPSSRIRALGVLRIVFGLAWAADAGFKWVPAFIGNFTTYLSTDGQPKAFGAWISFWINTIKVDPHVFAHLVAAGETAIAIGLILGLFSNLTYLLGSLLSVMIWTTAEGFGGPYSPGSTDIGAAIIYVFVFAALFLTDAGRIYGLDGRLGNRLGRFAFLASGRTEPAPAP